VYGTKNNSTLITEHGLYFIDDKEKNIIRLSKDGTITKIGAGRMGNWMKEYIIPGTYTYATNTPIHLEYDPIHKDIYIMNDEVCLIYNESLDSFTSFMDYYNCHTIFPSDNELIAITYNNKEDLRTYSTMHWMFAG
jgi:hypothetical protein